MRNPAALAIIVLLAGCAPDGPPVAPFEPPDIEDWTGEPQVAEKIQQARGQALAAPESSLAAGRLGMAFHAHDLLPEALACYRRAAALAPGEPRWPYLMAQVTSRSDLAGSVPLFERAAELGLDHPALHVSLGDVLARLGRPEEAVAQYEKAMALDPDNTHALYGLAQQALASGETEAAALHLERAAQLAPWHGEVHTLLAQVYQRLGRGDDAARELRQADRAQPTSRTPDPLLAEVEGEAVSSQAYSRRGQKLAEEGRFGEAEAQFRQVLEIRPGTARDFSNLGGALAGQGRRVEAIEQYRRALEADPGDTYTLNNLGLTLAEGGELDEAARQLARALEIDPAYADAHRNLGLVLERQGRAEEAIAQYRLALEHNPSLALAHTDLGAALARRGELDQAVGHWRQALDIDPRELSALYNLSIALVQLGEHAEALRWLRRGIEIAPNSSRLVSLLAWELATAPDGGLRDATEAERLARRVFESFPDQPQTADVLAAALAAQGRFDEAVPIAEKAHTLARQSGQRLLAEQIRSRLELYRRQQPFDQSLVRAE